LVCNNTGAIMSYCKGPEDECSGWYWGSFGCSPMVSHSSSFFVISIWFIIVLLKKN
jgi:hypothetical protein